MNKSEIIKNLSLKIESLSDNDVEKSVNIILTLVSESLVRTDRVELRNFGTFSTRTREKHISRNPKTGTSILVQAKNHPYFRASKYLKESLNN